MESSALSALPTISLCENAGLSTPAPKAPTQKGRLSASLLRWCGRQGSNLHTDWRKILNLMRLPIPPRPRSMSGVWWNYLRTRPQNNIMYDIISRCICQGRNPKNGRLPAVFGDGRFRDCADWLKAGEGSAIRPAILHRGHHKSVRWPRPVFPVRWYSAWQPPTVFRRLQGNKAQCPPENQ